MGGRVRKLVIKENFWGWIEVYGGMAYHVRDILKEYGFRWNPTERKWEFANPHPADVRKATGFIGIALELPNVLVRTLRERGYRLVGHRQYWIDNEGIPEETIDIFEFEEEQTKEKTS